MKSDNKLRQPRRRLSIKAANPYHDKGVKRENTDKLILKKQNTPTTGQTTPSSASLSFNKLVTSTKQAISELLTKIGDWPKARFDPRGDRVRMEAVSSLGSSGATLATSTNQESVSSPSGSDIEMNTNTDRQGQGSQDDRMHMARLREGGSPTLSEEIYELESKFGKYPVFSGWNAYCGMHIRPRMVPATYWDDLIAQRRAKKTKEIIDTFVSEETLAASRGELDQSLGSNVYSWPQRRSFSSESIQTNNRTRSGNTTSGSSRASSTEALRMENTAGSSNGIFGGTSSNARLTRPAESRSATPVHTNVRKCPVSAVGTGSRVPLI